MHDPFAFYRKEEKILEILKTIEQVNGSINGFVWGIVGLLLLIGTGILMTCLTGWFQVTRIGHWWKKTIGSMFTKKVLVLTTWHPASK